MYTWMDSFVLKWDLSDIMHVCVLVLLYSTLVVEEIDFALGGR